MKKVTMMTVDLDKLVSFKGAVKIGLCVATGKMVYEWAYEMYAVVIKGVVNKMEEHLKKIEQQKWKEAAENKAEEEQK